MHGTVLLVTVRTASFSSTFGDLGAHIPNIDIDKKSSCCIMEEENA